MKYTNAYAHNIYWLGVCDGCGILTEVYRGVCPGCLLDGVQPRPPAEKRKRKVKEPSCEGNFPACARELARVKQIEAENLERERKHAELVIERRAAFEAREARQAAQKKRAADERNAQRRRQRKERVER